MRHNSRIYNAGKFKYWLYQFHFSQAKIEFLRAHILLCPVVSNIFLHSFTYGCRVDLVHHTWEDSVEVRNLPEKYSFQRFLKLFLLPGLIADQLHKTDLSFLLLMTEFIHCSLLFRVFDVQTKSIAYLVYWVTKRDKIIIVLTEDTALYHQENIFRVSLTVKQSAI